MVSYATFIQSEDATQMMNTDRTEGAMALGPTQRAARGMRFFMAGGRYNANGGWRILWRRRSQTLRKWRRRGERGADSGTREAVILRHEKKPKIWLAFKSAMWYLTRRSPEMGAETEACGIREHRTIWRFGIRPAMAASVCRTATYLPNGDRSP